MSAKAFAVAVHRSRSRNTARLVLLLLADSAADNGYCWFRWDDLARKANLTEDTARKVVDQLAADNEATLFEQESPNGERCLFIHCCASQKPDDAPKPAKASAPKRAGERLDPAFRPTPALLAWAREHAPDADPYAETDKFVNHFTAMADGNKNARKCDWNAAWRNWMLRAQERLDERKQQGRGYAPPAARPAEPPADLREENLARARETARQMATGRR